MSVTKPLGILQKPRAKMLPIHEMDMGVASDANVATFARNARRFALLGRPRPHSRLRLQTAHAATQTTLSIPPMEVRNELG